MRPAPTLVVPVAAAGARVSVVAGGQPFLGQVPQPQIIRCARPPILVGTHPGSTALLSVAGHRPATAAINVVTSNLLSEYEPAARRPAQSRPSTPALPL